MEPWEDRRCWLAAARPVRHVLAMKTVLLAAVLLGFLALSLVFAWSAWTGLEDVDMTIHGWIALILGIVVTVALGGGLMWLSFKSSRDGWDDIHRP